MTGHRIDPRTSLGNIISLAGTVLTALAVLATLLMWGARQVWGAGMAAVQAALASLGLTPVAVEEDPQP